MSADQGWTLALVGIWFAFGFSLGWRLGVRWVRQRRRPITVIEFTPDNPASGGQESAEARSPLNGGTTKDHLR